MKPSTFQSGTRKKIWLSSMFKPSLSRFILLFGFSHLSHKLRFGQDISLPIHQRPQVERLHCKKNKMSAGLISSYNVLEKASYLFDSLRKGCPGNNPPEETRLTAPKWKPQPHVTSNFLMLIYQSTSACCSKSMDKSPWSCMPGYPFSSHLPFEGPACAACWQRWNSKNQETKFIRYGLSSKTMKDAKIEVIIICHLGSQRT